jgi:hypothetical protein
MTNSFNKTEQERKKIISAVEKTMHSPVILMTKKSLNSWIGAINSTALGVVTVTAVIHKGVITVDCPDFA